MKHTMILLIGVLFIGCTPDPYEADKARVKLTINTEGNTELLRDVKFELFEPSGALMAEKTDRYLDSLYTKRLAEDIEHQETSILKFSNTMLTMAEDDLKRAKRSGYRIMGRDYYYDKVKEAKADVEKEELELENLKNEIFPRPRILTFYQGAKQKLRDNSANGDTIVYYYNTVYIIDNVRTTQTFTMAKDEAVVGRLSVKNIKDAAYKEWRKSLGLDE